MFTCSNNKTVIQTHDPGENKMDEMIRRFRQQIEKCSVCQKYLVR